VERADVSPRVAVAIIAADGRITTADLFRYDPARVGEFGPEFAALAIRRLVGITDGYEAALASFEPSAS
jgi:hypothetical protein